MKTIAVDFDGVIHKYSDGWKDGSIYDTPVKDAIKSIQRLRQKGYQVIVFTTRENLDEVERWLNNHLGWHCPVTNIKPKAIAYIDDRAIRFTNWNDVLKYFC